jgi:NodT family efflux transporter outer membrane factor (OMF) lipoprotein
MKTFTSPWLILAIPALAAASAAIPSCALKRPPDAAAIATEALGKTKAPAGWTAASSPASVKDDWVSTFHDDQLTAAVKEAIEYNADLRVAAARVEQAFAYARLAGAKLYPSVDLLARGGGKLSGDNSGLQGALLSATWEIDVWGRVRYGRAAAAADAAAAQADYEFARQSLAATVARNWFLAIEAAVQADVARNSIDDSEELVRLAEARARIGVGNDEDVFVARANVGSYRDSLRQLQLAREQAIRGLEILLGRYPAADISVPTRLPVQPEAIPAGLPSQLLERRPDVIAAERRIAAAFHRVHEAKAARLPAIALTSGVSAISSDLFVLKERDNPVWSLGANLLMPVFRGGALKTQVDIRTAEQAQAVAAYATVGLRAFGEVENALASEIAAHDRQQILADTLSHNQSALGVVRTQFKVGSTDLRFVSQRQIALYATNAALVRVEAEQLVQRVNLHLALGGSFEGRSPERKAEDR